MLAWLVESTQQLLGALRESGPERGCWTWWGTSQTAGAVARHRLQEIAMHTYDAQLTVGAPQSLPDKMALDSVDEFLSTCCATTSPWPHRPAAVDFHAAEGPLLAPLGLRRRRTGHGYPHARRSSPARTRTRPTPPPGAWRVSWSWPGTAAFRWTP